MGGALVNDLDLSSPTSFVKAGKKKFLNQNKSMEKSKQKGKVAYKNES